MGSYRDLPKNFRVATLSNSSEMLVCSQPKVLNILKIFWKLLEKHSQWNRPVFFQKLHFIMDFFWEFSYFFRKSCLSKTFDGLVLAVGLLQIKISLTWSKALDPLIRLRLPTFALPFCNRFHLNFQIYQNPNIKISNIY